ncbi:hypothetical protein GGS20DRAFT_556540 [Poronia punctata]|nr:hypothetical protein GGS20DRAFT_556540 [Poronia punctata]
MAPNQTSGSGRRKRARTESDIVSSPAVAPSPTNNIAASAKRRRLNRVADSPSSTPKGFSAITSAIGGALGRIRGRTGTENGPSKEQRGTTAGSAYDVPDSEGEEQEEIFPSKPKKLDFGKATKVSKTKKNPYDIPNSGDELDSAKGATQPKENKPGTPSKRSAGTPNDKGADSRPTPARRGRPPKAMQLLPQPAVKARIYGPPPLLRGASTSSATPSSPIKGILTPQKSKADRPALRTVKSVAFDDDELGSNISGGDITPRPKSMPLENKPQERRDEGDTRSKPSKAVVTSRPKANGTNNKPRGRKKEDDNASPVLDIVGDARGAEKVANDNEEFEDEEEEEEDDEVCVICLKPHSEPPNEIVFCEVCDRGFHQECYNVPVIPEGDWICRTCSQEDILQGAAPSAKKAFAAATTGAVPDILNFEQHLQTMRRTLLDRCSGNRRIKLRGQDEAYEKAFQLVEQTVLAGEGNSMMVIGGRGCGKTTMVEDIISDLRKEHFEDFHVVRLNGFIHTDDKLALKEIWRQLGKEMEIEDDLVNKTNNYADTMASLLALLSHPTEITEADEGVTSKSVVFIIDEFELFATHARQTLLYNLFDIAQARKAPIAVLGLTTRIDVVESLEKRVKSRFSHRYVYLSLPKSLPAFWDICRQGLTVDQSDLEAEGFDTNLKGLSEFHSYWNKKIEAFRQTPAFESHLEYLYYTNKSVAAFLTSCILPLSALSLSSLDLEVPSHSGMGMGMGMEPQEPRLQLLGALSDLELALLISAARLDIVAHTDTVNFAMAYDEYSTQMGRQRVQTASSGLLALGAGARIWSRSVAVVAWERLVSLGLLIPAGIGGRSNAAHGGLEAKMWRMDVSLEEIPLAVELPGFLVKWCTQI